MMAHEMYSTDSNSKLMSLLLGWLLYLKSINLVEPPLNGLLLLYTVSWTKYHINCYSITLQVMYALKSPTLFT